MYDCIRFIMVKNATYHIAVTFPCFFATMENNCLIWLWFLLWFLSLFRQFCKERDIPYVHFPTLGDNVTSCCDHLWDLGHTEPPAGVKLKEEEQWHYVMVEKLIGKVLKTFNLS
jgi:hypothetical protein